MNTVTLSLEDYNELKAKADAYDNQMKLAKLLFLDGNELVKSGQINPNKK